jgi:hypothetical protein
MKTDQQNIKFTTEVRNIHQPLNKRFDKGYWFIRGVNAGKNTEKVVCLVSDGSTNINAYFAQLLKNNFKGLDSKVNYIFLNSRRWVTERYVLLPYPDVSYFVDESNEIKRLNTTKFQQRETSEIAEILQKIDKWENPSPLSYEIIKAGKDVSNITLRDIHPFASSSRSEVNARKFIYRKLAENLRDIRLKNNTLTIRPQAVINNGYFLGYPTITICTSLSSVKITNIIHPHIRGSGYPCFGSYKQKLHRFFRIGDIISVIYLLLLFIQDYNPSDAYRDVAKCGLPWSDKDGIKEKKVNVPFITNYSDYTANPNADSRDTKHE